VRDSSSSGASEKAGRRRSGSIRHWRRKRIVCSAMIFSPLLAAVTDASVRRRHALKPRKTARRLFRLSILRIEAEKEPCGNLWSSDHERVRQIIKRYSAQFSTLLTKASLVVSCARAPTSASYTPAALSYRSASVARPSSIRSW
jgi:hypothetical protein